MLTPMLATARTPSRQAVSSGGGGGGGRGGFMPTAPPGLLIVPAPACDLVTTMASCQAARGVLWTGGHTASAETLAPLKSKQLV